MNNKKIVFIAMCLMAIFNYGMEIVDATGKKIMNTENVDHAEEIIRSLRKNDPLNRYYYRNSITNKKNFPSAPNAVFEYGKARYIETARNQKYKICLENGERGFWEGLVPFQLTKDNCLLLTTPNRTGSLLFVFFNASTPSDSVWILNNQKLIDLSKETHLIWSIDSIIGPEYKRRVYGSYKETRLNKILVVDRTEATVGEVKFLCDYFGTFYKPSNLWYPDSNPLNHPNLPQDPSYAIDSDYANNRSKFEGFEIASRANGADTTKNGYRLPTHDEWVALQRGGSKKDYYWGNETDSLTISQYEWYKPRKERVHEVGLLKPNPYGLYDVMGNATESILHQGRECLSSDESSNECWMKNNLMQHEAEEFCYTHIKYKADKEKTVVKECDLRYKKNPFRGFRLVRQIFVND
ncbi:SUMF1/EgtB/PvdO family nonheme iron enzyme [Fibrobacter intestinalis]|uniref:Formylglycine-generating enzyme, required for sulfatase activity, contains SUMF1/FGE domain n=1 Tax=Fibrobacter intestinalis TaxID=28122 RepID=A0A1T4LYV1_9BACT|nr:MULTISPECIES: SUMF1/EgtB/PvdO family nonheme iron enzyme [Fibrobacter]PBC74823.1 formylglycine-generating enzyme required for sulfatase activity [Fibrobacter sp. NR9]SJZ59900.1 Formylglycine-generating enzyme, required for sulfatase activity, contains SUMF1/FGE domain [Fibrobacter intestinalis]